MANLSKIVVLLATVLVLVVVKESRAPLASRPLRDVKVTLVLGSRWSRWCNRCDWRQWNGRSRWGRWS